MFTYLLPSSGLRRYFVASERLKFVVNVLPSCNQFGHRCRYVGSWSRGLAINFLDDLQAGMRADMRAESDSYVVDVLLAIRSPWRHAGVITRRLLNLTASALDPHRPELHYMRGPGPKWRQKMGGSDRCTSVIPRS